MNGGLRPILAKLEACPRHDLPAVLAQDDEPWFYCPAPLDLPLAAFGGVRWYWTEHEGGRYGVLALSRPDDFGDRRWAVHVYSAEFVGMVEPDPAELIAEWLLFHFERIRTE